MNRQETGWHNCEGVLDFEPKTADGKGGNPGWLILRCDDGIGEYYQWWIEKHHHIKIERPLFGGHVSVMRGELPTENADAWKNRQDERVAFQYHHEFQSADGFWWLPVSCPKMEQLRLSFGLSALPEHGFHMTIGRTR